MKSEKWSTKLEIFIFSQCSNGFIDFLEEIVYIVCANCGDLIFFSSLPMKPLHHRSRCCVTLNDVIKSVEIIKSVAIEHWRFNSQSSSLIIVLLRRHAAMKWKIVKSFNFNFPTSSCYEKLNNLTDSTHIFSPLTADRSTKSLHSARCLVVEASHESRRSESMSIE